MSLILTAVLGGLTLWNFSASGVSAQKSEEDFGVVTGVAYEYNARNEFSLVQDGTNGLWRYGYSASQTDNNFTEFVTADTIPICGGQFSRWYVPNSDVVPQIAAHNLGTPCANIPPNALFIHPGQTVLGSGDPVRRAVVRWTAPMSGTFQLTGSLQRQNTGATADLKIIKNAATAGESVVYSASNTATYQISYNVSVTVAAGDRLDFSVGDGGNGYNGDGSSIVINISQPITACLTASANLQVFVPAENSPSDVQSVNTNAALVGDATYANMGKVGRAFDFDGNGDYVRIEDNAAQRPATAVTVEGWFKFDTVPGGIVSLVSKPLRNSAFNSYSLYMEGGQLRGFASNTSQFTRVFSNFTPQTGVWHHLAFTYDFTGGISTLKLFANGAEVTSGQDGTANLPLFYDANPYPLLIGGEFENNAPGFFFDGQADEISIYGRALAPTEVFDIVQHGSSGKCSPGASCSSAPNDLISWYRGEQNALDSSSLNHGTLQNGAAFNANGKAGQSFNFDGVNDYVQTPVNMKSRATIEAWVNPSTLAGGFTDATFPGVTRRAIAGSAGSFSDLIIGLYGGKLGAIYKNNSGTVSLLQSNLPIQIGQWYHLAVTIDGTTARLYVNGSLEASGTTAANYTPHPDTRIGSASCCSGDNFAGQVDEVSFYKRALTDAEIQAIFNAGASGKCSTYVCANAPDNLVSWFAGEQNALDSKSNNHGATQNGATFASGKVGQAFSLDGNNDYVSTVDSADYDFGTGDFAIESWIISPNSTGAQRIISAGSQADGANNLWSFGYGTIWGSGIRLNFAKFNGGGFNDYTSDELPMLPNTWHHVAVVRSGATIRFYFDRNPAGTLNINPADTFNGGGAGAVIGARYAANPSNVIEFANGRLDEVSIYKRALSVAEISTIYNAGTSGKCKPTGLNPAANQIAWFAGDGDTRDFIGLNPNGILRGDTNYRVGKVGQSFNLDGSGDYIEVPADADHRPATQLTAEGWFKFNNLNNFPHLVGLGLRGSDRNSYVMWFGNGNIRIGYSDSGSNFIFYDTGFVPNSGTFYHLAMALNTDDAGANANTFKLYVNGAQVFSGAAAGSIYYDANPYPLTIGADINNDVPDFPLNGQIDEVSLYSRALSAPEIAAIYNAGTAGKLKSVITPVNFVGAATKRRGDEEKKNAESSNIAVSQIAPTTVQLTDATVTFAQVTGAGTTSQNGIDLSLLPKLPSTVTFTGLAYDISTTVVYQSGAADDVRVCFNLPSLGAIGVSSLRILHLENGAWINRTAAGNTLANFCTDNLTSLSPFVIVQSLAPSSAVVSVSGRIADAEGRGIRNAVVTLTDARGNSRSTRTGSFGSYRFSDVRAGEVNIVRVQTKRFRFNPDSQAINVTDAVEDADFSALPEE